MVDIQFINNNNNISILSTFISSSIESPNFIIQKDTKNKFWQLKYKNESYYNILSIDTTDMINNYAKKLLNNNFDSILISGLGLGIIPFLCQEQTSIVDVIELKSEVINITTNVGHLKPNVNIINEDIYNFNPTRNYDIILFDHWMIYAPESDMELLNNKFSSYLNSGGFTTFPIHEQTQKNN